MAMTGGPRILARWSMVDEPGNLHDKVTDFVIGGSTDGSPCRTHCCASDRYFAE